MRLYGMRAITILLAFVSLAMAQNSSSPAGTWLSSFKVFDQTVYQRLQIEVAGTKITGKLDNGVFEGTFQGGRIEGTVNRGQDAPMQISGVLNGDRITGSLKVGNNDPRTWEAVRQPPRGAPRTLTFEPTEFHHFF